MPSRTRLAFVILPLYAMSYAIPTLGTQEKIQVVRKSQTADVIAPISVGQEASFKPFTFFASAAYCSSSATKNWNCGGKHFVLLALLYEASLLSFSPERCDANAGFIPTASGGDGTDVQFCMSHPCIFETNSKANFLPQGMWVTIQAKTPS